MYFTIKKLYNFKIKLLRSIVNNNVRDNNVKHIKEFTRNEVRLLTNGSFFLMSIKYSLYVIVSISQIDITLIKVLIGELACVFTTHIQLSDKTFMDGEYTLVSNVEVITSIEMV